VLHTPFEVFQPGASLNLGEYAALFLGCQKLPEVRQPLDIKVIAEQLARLGGLIEKVKLGHV